MQLATCFFEIAINVWNTLKLPVRILQIRRKICLIGFAFPPTYPVGLGFTPQVGPKPPDGINII